MNRHLRRFFVAATLGYTVLQLVETATLGYHLVRHELAPEPEPMIDWARMERAAELEWNAGDRHPFIGNDPFSCALCLIEEAHPIHRLDEPA